MDAKESASICHAFMFHTLKLSYIKIETTKII